MVSSLCVMRVNVPAEIPSRFRVMSMPFTVILSNIVAADGLGGRFAAVVNFPRDNNAIVALRWAGGGRDAVVV